MSVTKYIIKEIDSKIGLDLIVKNHYLHKSPNVIVHCFGLFDADILIGVIIYSPLSSPLTKKSFFKDTNIHVYELSRLWVEDGTPKNTESYFIANTIKKIDCDAIISFADSSMGHNGTVYQACSFKYLGLSPSAKNYTNKLTGEQPGLQFKSVKQFEKDIGKENVILVERSRKHRYVFLKNKRIELKLKEHPYPKKEPTNFIYALKDPDILGGSIRYIGQSSVGKKRIFDHGRPYSLKMKNHKNNWINSLRRENLDYAWEIIEDLGNFSDMLLRKNSLNEREIHWIFHYRNLLGDKLTNGTLGGDGSQGRILSQETKDKISSKAKERGCNNLEKYKFKPKPHVIVNGIEYKHCANCDKIKLLTDFHKSNKYSDKLQASCKECLKVYRKKYQDRDRLSPEKLKASYANRMTPEAVAKIKATCNSDRVKSAISQKNSKAVVGTNIMTGDVIEFSSASKAKDQGFSNVNIGRAIKNNKPYKGYTWKFKS